MIPPGRLHLLAQRLITYLHTGENLDDHGEEEDDDGCHDDRNVDSDDGSPLLAQRMITYLPTGGHILYIVNDW